jgi:hypothetical protein
MKTLVIHIEDRTTDFLKKIYENIDCTIIRDGYSGDIIREIKNHDRIIMCGHGCPSGLFGKRGMIISNFAVPYLRDKECIFIWCNADKFVKKHNLTGFYSGMFISEVTEAEMYGIKTNEEDICFSNIFFSRMVGNCLRDDMSLKETFMIVKDNYTDEKNPVVGFNNNRLYYSKTDGNFILSYQSMNGSVSVEDDDFDMFMERQEYLWDEYAEEYDPDPHGIEKKSI